MRTPPEESEMLALLEAEPVTRDHLGRAALLRMLGEEGTDAEREHVAGCPHCRPRLDAIEAERRAFLTRHPPAAFLAAIEARRGAPRPTWASRLGWLGGALALAAALLLLLRPAPEPLSEPYTEPGTRLKGAVHLSFHVRSGDVVRDGVPGAVLRPGDAIQLRYSTPAHRHLVVVSLDSQGAVTPFYDAGGRSLVIEPGAARLLEGSVVLDGALGPERIIGCFSDAPLDTGAVLAAGRAALLDASGDPRRVERLPLDCAQAAITIEKRAE